MQGLGRNFVQIQGKGRFEVLDLAKKLNLGSVYIPYPYIEQVQLENMTQQLRDKTEVSAFPFFTCIPSLSPTLADARAHTNFAHPHGRNIGHAEGRDSTQHPGS